MLTLGPKQLGVVFGLIAVACLVAVAVIWTPESIRLVLLIAAGMATMAALSALQQPAVIDLPAGDPRRRVTSAFSFNTGQIEQEIQAGVAQLPKARVITVEAVPQETTPPPWEVTASSLVGVDNALALAKLRVDIERELRRLEYTGGKQSPRVISLSGLVQQLVRQDLLPARWYGPIRTINQAASQAIHGAGTPEDEQTRRLVDVGEELLELLRTIQPKAVIEGN